MDATTANPGMSNLITTTDFNENNQRTHGGHLKIAPAPAIGQNGGKGMLLRQAIYGSKRFAADVREKVPGLP